MENVDAVAPHELLFDLIRVGRDGIRPTLGSFPRLGRATEYVAAGGRRVARIVHLAEHVSAGVGLSVRSGDVESSREHEYRGTHTYIDCCVPRAVTPRDSGIQAT